MCAISSHTSTVKTDGESFRNAESLLTEHPVLVCIRYYAFNMRYWRRAYVKCHAETNLGKNELNGGCLDKNVNKKIGMYSRR